MVTRKQPCFFRRRQNENARIAPNNSEQRRRTCGVLQSQGFVRDGGEV